MPKRLSEYTFREHLRLQPLTQAWKTLNYRMMDARYMALPAAAGDTAAIRAAIAGCNILATVAFDDPSGLAMHVSLIRRYVTFDHHIVLDNSGDLAMARENHDIAASWGAHYLRLPPNPWTRRNDSRSHGIALNWVWRNVIKPGGPHAFGFIDDDMFPVAPVDPFAPLATHPFYGDTRTAGPRWFLWAGYCFFRYDAVADKRLDFGLDWFIGLDTGGANWDVLYRDVDPKSLPARRIEPFAALADQPRERAYFERRGEWIHEVGWPSVPELLERKRSALTLLLKPHLDAERPSRPDATRAGADGQVLSAKPPRAGFPWRPRPRCRRGPSRSDRTTR